MLITTILASAMLQGAVATAPRKQFVSCLNEAVRSAKAQNVAADQFDGHAHQACAAIEAQLKQQLASFGRKNGLSKKAADEDAQVQLDDYVYTAAERYRFELEDSAPKQDQPVAAAAPKKD